MAIISSCSNYSKTYTDQSTSPTLKMNKVSTSKKVHPLKKLSSKDISGTLSSGGLYEATPDEEGYVISFDPFIAKKDEVFSSATSQIIAKLYNDKLKDDSHISIESDIDYTIFHGLKARYKIIPNKETNGEISSITITSLL